MMASSTLGMLLAGCAVADAFFVASEVALSACDRGRLRQRAAAGKSRAVRVERMLAVPQVTLATTLVGANLAILVAVLAVGLELHDRQLSLMLAPLFVIPPLLVIGHLVPKAIVQAHADAIVDAIANPLRLMSFVLRPIVFVVGAFAGVVTRVARSDRKKAFVTRDELALLIESEPGTDKPDIGADERAMISNVFELSEYKVGELMVPLSEITALEEDTAIKDAALEIADKQHSRMPIYKGRIDEVVGIVHVFDVLQAAGRMTSGPGTSDKMVGALAKAPTYVPETMKASDLLVQLQTEQTHLAVVVNEYGKAVGICTIEDLLEIIVGDIDDEFDTEPSPIKVERPGVWRVEARTPVERLNTELELGLPESDDYETIAGFLIEKYRRIPEKGETLALPGMAIEVIAANDRAIEAVRITKRKK